MTFRITTTVFMIMLAAGVSSSATDAPPAGVQASSVTMAAEDIPGGAAPYEIEASGIRNDSARITWTTDIPGTTGVEYGASEAYGEKSDTDALPRMNHFADLKGLKSNTIYHYRVMTTDIWGNVHTSADQIFTTLNAPPPGGKVYYVSTRGDDGNDGMTLKTAWRRIGYAAGKVKAGDTVKIEGGTYEEDAAGPEKSVEVKTGGKKVAVETWSAVNIKTDGTDVSPITFEGFNGVPVLDGSKFSVANRNTFGILISGSYINVRGLKVTGYAIGIRPIGTRHVSIVGCEVGPTGSVGIKARNNTYLLIDNCDVHNNGWNSFMLEVDQQPASESHHYTITNCKIHDNSAHNLMDITVHFGNKNSHHHFDIVNNELYKCTSNGFFVHWDERPVIKHFNWSNNNLHHNGTHAMRVNALEDSYICNNTFAENSIGRGDSEIVGSCRNVIFYKNTGAKYVDVQGDGLMFLQNNFPYIRSAGQAIVRDNRPENFTVRTGQGKMAVEFTDGRVFSTKRTWNSGEYDITEPVCSPGGSGFQMEAFGFGATSQVITYPVCAVPEKDSVKVTGVVASPLSFTAATKDGNNVTFTAEGLEPGKQYDVKTDGKSIARATADKDGRIKFAHSDWKQTRKFTVEPVE